MLWSRQVWSLKEQQQISRTVRRGLQECRSGGRLATRLAVAGLACIFMATPSGVLAQTNSSVGGPALGAAGPAPQASTGVALAGTVVDPSGTGAAGAKVALKQGAETTATTQTDGAGRFRFEDVVAGHYVVEVQDEGFAPSATPVEVRGRLLAALTIKLILAGVNSQVTVNADAPTMVSTDIADNRDAASVNQALLEDVPVFDQDYVTAVSAFLDAASVGTSGPQLIVNGVAVTSLTVSPSAVQEVRINQNPYSADMARPGRGSIEIITKDPTTQYHGTVNFIFRDAVFNARDPFALTRPAEQRRIWEGAVTGPIWHTKKTSLLLSGHRQEEDLQSIVFAQDLSGPVQENVPSPKRDTQLSTHVEHQFSEKRTIFGQYNEWDYSSQNQGVGGFVLPEAGNNQTNFEREWVFGDRWAPSGKWLSQFQILIGWERHAMTGVNDAPKIVVAGAFTSGGAQVNRLEIEKHVQLSEMVSWSSGKHFVKFGVNLPDWSQRTVTNHNNNGGTYTFSSLAAYQNAQPSTFQEQLGPGYEVYWQQELGLFVQDDYRLRQNFSLSLGLRYSWQNALGDDKQFAPRFALAYSPDKKRKTVVRAGAGIFYDHTGAGPVGDLLLYNGVTVQSYTLTSGGPIPPTYPETGPLTGPVDTEQFDPTIREPYTLQYSVSVERQLARRTTLAVAYYGQVGVDLFRSRDINAPVGGAGGVIPDPSKGVVRQIESAGRQTGNSLEVTLRGDITKYFTGLAQYTLGSTWNNTGGINWFPANQYDLTGEWARADFDQRNRFNMLESFKPGKSFTFGVGLSLTSGRPYSETTGTDVFGTGMLNARPPGVARNTLVGPGYADMDLRVSRDFYLSKKKEKGMMATVALDAFNVFNRVNYTAYVGTITSPFFGQAVSANPARRMQLTVRFKF